MALWAPSTSNESLAGTLQQVSGSAKTLFDAARVGLMLVDQDGALGWASASDGMEEARSGDLAVPVHVGGGPVGTLDVYVTAPRRWDDSEVAALHAYAGLVASLLVAAVTARVTGRLADQLRAALEHRLLIEQAVEILVDREGLDAQGALAWLGAAAQVVRMPADPDGPRCGWWGAAALGPTRPGQGAAARGHRPRGRYTSPGLELHEGAARGYERRGQAGRAQTERLQAAAARGRIIDAEAERRRADSEP